MLGAPTQVEMQEAIRAALRSGQHQDAKASLDTALRLWPKAYWALLLQGDVLAAGGDTDAALDYFRALEQRFPNNLHASLRVVRLLLEQDRIAEARTAFADVVWPSAARGEDKSALLTALSPRHGDLDATVRFLERLLPGNERDPVLLARLGAIRDRLGQPDEALALFEDAAALGPLPAYAQPIYADLLIFSGRSEVALPIAQALAAARPDRIDCAMRMVLALSRLGRSHEAALMLKQAAERWPDDWRLLFRFNRSKPLPPVTEATFDIIRANWGRGRFEDRAGFQYALACLCRGMMDTALQSLHSIQHPGPASHMAKALELALSKFSPAQWHARGRLADDPAAELQFVQVDGADTTIMIFGGIIGGVSYLPFRYVDTLLAGYRANVVYLRDYAFQAYFTGISSIAPNREETIRRLDDIARRLGTRRLITLGTCAGGFAAVRYGTRLGAEAVASFGAPTTLEPEFKVAGKLKSGYDPDNAKRALVHFQEGKDLIRDMMEAPTTRLFHYYATQYPPEAEHAERLRGLGNVVLRPMPGIDHHFGALHAVAGDAFDRLLTEDLGIPLP